jgi:hypothetical protein
VPVLGPELRRLSPIARPDSQETDTAPDSVVTPTSRSSRLGKRGCERVKSTPRHPSPVAVLCSATMVIINGASGLFMAKRRLPGNYGMRFGPQLRGVAIRGVRCEIYAKGRKLLYKSSSCSSLRHAYVTLSSVLPSIVISSVADRSLFGFCVRVYRSSLSIRGAIRASLVGCFWDSQRRLKPIRAGEGQPRKGHKC